MAESDISVSLNFETNSDELLEQIEESIERLEELRDVAEQAAEAIENVPLEGSNE